MRNEVLSIIAKSQYNIMNTLPKKIHVIGICGVATSAIAIAFKKRGVYVTGSDKGFFPPVSTELEKQGVDFYAGWHPEKMTEKGVPDTVMIGAASGSQNPETTYAKEHGIPMFSYPEMIGEYFVKKNSIVCSGTWGKTSSSALLSFILSETKMDPTYMFGGVSLSHESSAKLGSSEWSVFEGDEYKSSPTDARAKFFHYKPTHLLLSAVSWDHADLYTTEESYFDAFRKLLAGMPETGLLVARAEQPGIKKIVDSFNGRMITYGAANSISKTSVESAEPAEPDFTYSNVEQSKAGIDFTISHNSRTFHIHSPMLGTYQAENITGCFAMATSIGIAPEKIVEAISKFKGLKRRMEKRLGGDETTGPSNASASNSITVIDDIAHSPEKAVSVLVTLKEIYGGKNGGRIITVFEPNIGGRERQSAAKYDNAFKNADHVIIPRLTKLKIADSGSAAPMEGVELAATISKTQKNILYIDDDKALVEHLISIAKPGDVVAFLGSHGFRGMIEEAVSLLNK
jgi:UDP-N-acetylmuramate: L-alanyl-gamma-D-glutamyl-meso-diaminopimelate ligase